MKIATFVVALAAGCFVAIPAVAAPVNTAGAQIIADISRDAVEMSRDREVLPTVADLSVSYPEVQAREGITGTTIVAVRLDDHGKLVTASIYKSSGNKFMDNMARIAVGFAKFTPGSIAGNPVGGDYALRIDFGNG